MGAAGERRRAARIAAGLIGLLAAPASAGPFDDAGYEPLAMAAWASEVEAFAPGPIDIAAPELGVASFGLPEYALGAATGDTFDVVSLGDGGSITLWLESGIQDGPGDDFAVWENAFFAPGGLYAELAFVEVSSNGVDFARLPAVALRTTPVGGGGVLDPSDYHNLAGRHPLALGTGFDLAALAEHPDVAAGLLDPKAVYWVRLVDVVGDGSRPDSEGRPVYDPYATPYAAGGFDLEAVGVLHPVPEPTAAAVLAAGTLALGALARRRADAPRCGDDR